MPKKRFNAEQIVTLLRQIDVLIAQDKSAKETPRLRLGPDLESGIECGQAKLPSSRVARSARYLRAAIQRYG